MERIPMKGRPTPEMKLSALGRRKLACAELRAIASEMRARKVNHGKSTSPTLIAWADRIDAECDKIEGGA